jgi:hypothetical protein
MCQGSQSFEWHSTELCQPAMIHSFVLDPRSSHALCLAAYCVTKFDSDGLQQPIFLELGIAIGKV